MSNYTLVTHNDLDGLSSVVLSKFFGIEFEEILVLGYEKVCSLESLMSNPNGIIITDLFVEEDVFNRLRSKTKYLQIYDHHISSRYLDKYDSQICDVSRCGSRIFYEEFIMKLPHFKHNDAVEKYVTLVDTYDRWQNTSPLFEDALNLNRLYSYYYSENGFIDSACNLLKRDMKYSDSNIKAINSILRDENTTYDYAVRNLGIYTDSKGVQYGVFPCRLYASIICNRILTSHSSMTYIIGYYSSGRLSLRAKPDFDLTSLKGIRGHKLAAGGFLSQNEIVELRNGKPIPYN